MKTLRIALCFAALMQAGCMTTVKVHDAMSGPPERPAAAVMLPAAWAIDLVTSPFQLIYIAYQLEKSGV